MGPTYVPVYLYTGGAYLHPVQDGHSWSQNTTFHHFPFKQLTGMKKAIGEWSTFNHSSHYRHTSMLPSPNHILMCAAQDIISYLWQRGLNIQILDVEAEN